MSIRLDNPVATASFLIVTTRIAGRTFVDQKPRRLSVNCVYAE